MSDWRIRGVYPMTLCHQNPIEEMVVSIKTEDKCRCWVTVTMVPYLPYMEIQFSYTELTQVISEYGIQVRPCPLFSPYGID